jgi:hypothetical protein
MNEFEPTDPAVEEFSDIAAELRAGRPQLSSTELARVRTRAFGSTSAPQRLPRFAAVTSIALAVFAGGTGVTLGVAALAHGVNAADKQYGPDVPPPSPPDQGGVLGEHGSGHANHGGQPNHGGNDGLQSGGQEGIGGAGTSPLAEVQPAEQLASVDSGSLPFTGYLALPLLGLSLVMAGGGAWLLRRQRQPISAPQTSDASHERP